MPVGSGAADDRAVTALPSYDGTFSTEAVAATALALIDRLHAEAMATIAVLAEGGEPVPGGRRPAAADDGTTTWSDPGSWSVDIEQEEAAEAGGLPLPPLPFLLRPPRAVPAPARAVAA